MLHEHPVIPNSTIFIPSAIHRPSHIAMFHLMASRPLYVVQGQFDNVEDSEITEVKLPVTLNQGVRAVDGAEKIEEKIAEIEEKIAEIQI